MLGPEQGRSSARWKPACHAGGPTHLAKVLDNPEDKDLVRVALEGGAGNQPSHSLGAKTDPEGSPEGALS